MRSFYCIDAQFHACGAGVVIRNMSLFLGRCMPRRPEWLSLLSKHLPAAQVTIAGRWD